MPRVKSCRFLKVAGGSVKVTVKQKPKNGKEEHYAAIGKGTLAGGNSYCKSYEAKVCPKHWRTSREASVVVVSEQREEEGE